MTLELDQNPVQLYPEYLLSDNDQETKWRIAHVKSRREKKLVQFLSQNQIGYYLPLLKRRQNNKNRLRYSLMPLFTGYVFFKSTDYQRYLAMTSNHIARVIEVRDENRLVHELQQIKMALSLDLPMYPFDYIQEGQRVFIKRGPMKGIEGIVTKKKKNYRLILNVSSIFQSLAVDVDSDLVEPIKH